MILLHCLEVTGKTFMFICRERLMQKLGLHKVSMSIYLTEWKNNRKSTAIFMVDKSRTVIHVFKSFALIS